MANRTPTVSQPRLFAIVNSAACNVPAFLLNCTRRHPRGAELASPDTTPIGPLAALTEGRANRAELFERDAHGLFQVWRGHLGRG